MMQLPSGSYGYIDRSGSGEFSGFPETGHVRMRYSNRAVSDSIHLAIRLEIKILMWYISDNK